MGGIRQRNNRDAKFGNPKSSSSSGNKQKKSCSRIATLCFKSIIAIVILQRLLATPVWDGQLPSYTQETTTAIKPTNLSSSVDRHNQTIVLHVSTSSPSEANLTKLPITRTNPIPISKAAKCVHKLVTKVKSEPRKSTDTHRRQILYLHPGPPKTATTTIQQLLTDHQTQLNQDNIFFVGKTSPSERYNCRFPNPSYCIMYEQYAEKSDTNCTAIMEQQLDEYFRMGVDVVFSDEVIGAMFATPKHKKHNKRAKDALVAFFNTILRRNNWEIRLLIEYRPYFDFVKSQFSQLYTLRMIPSRSKQKFKGKPALYKWPGQQGGKHIPPIKDELFRNEWPTPDELLDLFQPYVDSIRVFDITQNGQRGNLSIRMFCNLLESAQQTCSFRKAILGASHHNRTEVRKNIAISLDYDRIATAAASNGMVSTTKSRRYDVTSEIKKFVQVSNNQTNQTMEICHSCVPQKTKPTSYTIFPWRKK